MFSFSQHFVTMLGTVCVTVLALQRRRAPSGLMKMAVFKLSVVVPRFLRVTQGLLGAGGQEGGTSE